MGSSPVARGEVAVPPQMLIPRRSRARTLARACTDRPFPLTVLPLRSCTHFDISVGLATTAAGPGAGPGYDRMLTHTLSSGRDTASSRSSLGMAGGMPAPLRYSPRAMHIERQSASDETYLRRE